MNKQRLLKIAKWVWVLLVLAGACIYFYKNQVSMLDHLRTFSPARILLSAILIISGKLILVQVSRASLDGQSWKPTYREMFHINSILQLAKFLPGGIWHFVGRFGFYRASGVSNRGAGQAILLENIWMVSSAVFFGGIMILLENGKALLERIGLPLPVWLVILSLGLLWLAALLVLEWVLPLRKPPSFIKTILQIPNQFLAWLLIGLGFFALVYLPGSPWQMAFTATGSFVLSWAAGYVTLFAPSGIGVREVVLTALLSKYLSPDGAAFYAAINRLIWTLCEILLGVIAQLLFGSLPATAHVPPPQDNPG